MNDALPRSGRCACGALRYQLLVEPMIVHACHCKNCQRETGTAYALNALVEAAGIVVPQGTLSRQCFNTPSGAGQTVTRCGDCGTPVWSTYHAFDRRYDAEIRFLRVGTLDNCRDIAPNVHIFTEAAVRSATEAFDAPRFEQFYELESVWRPASLKRLQSVSHRLSKVDACGCV